MAIFSYKAINGRRTLVQGTIAADTPRQARDLLRGRGLAVRQIDAQQATRGSVRTLWPRGRGQAAKLASTVRELATLLGVGIPLTESLDTLCRQHRGRFRTTLLLLRDRIAAGVSLAEAMAEQPDMFDPLCIHMTEVGESSGNLDVVLDQLADFKERSLDFKDRVLSAILYPLIVLTASLCVTVFLMTVVVPMLLTNLIEAGRQLPWPTRVLKGASDLLVTHGWILALGLAALILGAGLALRTATVRRLWHRALIRMPLIGPMTTKQTIARIAFVMSTLIRSGIVYLKAVEIAARSTGNVVFREALEYSSKAIGAGQDIGRAMERTGVFPPLVVHIFSVGQQSGRLEDLLDRLAATYDRQVTSSSSRLAAALEPMLILTLGVFVGFILFATLLPILEAGNVL